MTTVKSHRPSRVPAFLRRLFCKHGPWHLRFITWDGESIATCNKCGKVKKFPRQ